MEFDFVIVGGGSAGAVLAARLSENPAVSVCLIEAGGEGRGLLVRAPAGIAALVPGRVPGHNWRYESSPQPELGNRRVFQPRGRGLGGSSAINAMLYIRGHPGDYDDWAAAGCEGWSWRDVLPLFKRAEANQRGADAFHGADGPLQVRDQPSPNPASRAFVEAAMECQIPVSEDFNGSRQEGVGLYQVTQFHSGPHRGERCSAAAAYLHPASKRPNLEIVTGAHADRVEIAGGRAVAVHCLRGRQRIRVAARREVVLSAGAFGSPAILMRSGIGPGAELSRHGIPVSVDLPEVGANLQDHIDYIAVWNSRRRDLFGIGLRATLDLLRAAAEWRRSGTGLVSTPLAEAGGFVSSRPGIARPDLQLHFTIAKSLDHGRRLRLGYGFTGHVCVLRPHSRGTVALAAADPLAPPVIDPRYLHDRRDLYCLTAGVRILRAIFASPAMAPWRDREIDPPGEGDTAFEDHVRAHSETIYHPVGTCRMGADARSVVDPSLRVRGIGGLRVVDASVMPTLIGGNTNAPTIMIAEKASDLIRADLAAASVA